MTKEFIAEEFAKLQGRICDRLEKVDGLAVFGQDNWDREEGGGGKTRIIQNGAVIEKGGVAFSKVFGPVSDVMKKQLNLDGDDFFATGVSIVLHPSNPHVPIIHMNVRYFELNTGVFWFGGGIDLTPHYIVPKQATEFHLSLKTICDNYNSTFYSKFKTWADDYFFIPHRNETRGIGGIFFDRLSGTDADKDRLFSFLLDVGETFAPVYTHFMNLKKSIPY